MKIGLLGTGDIGGTLARRLSAAGHDVKIANSRGPSTIATTLLEHGARAVTAAEALTDVEVAILAIPLAGFDQVKSLVAALPQETVVIDTSNYIPQRDGAVAAIDAGQVEAEWVSEQLERDVVKAWNAIGAGSLALKSQVKVNPDRIAIPVSGSQHGREVAIALVEDSGFDGYDAGSLADSWRQQPGAPAYCTDLLRREMTSALNAAEKQRLSKRRDIAIAALMERGMANLTPEYLVRLNRALFM